ncbi:Imm21 family immunity protein [Haloglycomyces albus]|uniref:Imm21 family immunity protein n=1 Tax=Haloglycomyces albus TaxID=526067 RepID=UPI003CCC2816
MITDGGPIILLDSKYASLWGSVPIDVDPPHNISDWDDYGRACTVDDYLGLVQYGSSAQQSEAVVFGAERMTAYYSPELEDVRKSRHSRMCIMRLGSSLPGVVPRTPQV